MDFYYRSASITAASQFLAASKFLGYSTAQATQDASPYEQVVGDGVFVFALSTSMQGAGSRHKTIFIADLADARVSLQKSLPITIESAGESVVAYSYDLEELATGQDESAAITEMKALLVESYFLLKEEQTALGPIQQQHWDFLKHVVREANQS